jgi:Fibronectin type III domain
MTAPLALPYGLRDVKLTRYTDAGGTVLDTGTSVDLPNSQTFSFSESEEFTELRGDDKLVATHGQGSQVDWQLEAGGMSFAAWEIISGGVVTLTGLSPNQKWVLRKLSTSQRPYFRVQGRSISDSGGDVHGIVYRCRADDTIEGNFADGEFFITSCSGKGLPLINSDIFDLLYDFIINETATAIPSVPVANPTLQAPPTSLAAGTPAATTMPLTWVAAAGASLGSDYQVQRRTAFSDWQTATTTSATSTGATVTGLVTATQYQFRVRANTAANGPSDWTAAVTATTA